MQLAMTSSKKGDKVQQLIATDLMITLRHLSQVNHSRGDIQAHGGIEATVRVLADAPDVEVASNAAGRRSPFK